MSGTAQNENDAAKLAGCALRLAFSFAIVVWGACFFSLRFIVPKFRAVFAEMKVTLPGPTELVLLLSGPAGLVLALLVALALVLAWQRKNARLALGIGLAGLLFGVVAMGCIYLPLAKMEEALRKDRPAPTKPAEAAPERKGP
jgi:hypothetical protein